MCFRRSLITWNSNTKTQTSGNHEFYLGFTCKSKNTGILDTASMFLSQPKLLDIRELDFHTKHSQNLFNEIKKCLTVSRWKITSSTLCSLRTCHRLKVSKDRSISDLKLLKKVFSALSASADAETRRNHHWSPEKVKVPWLDTCMWHDHI